MAARWAHLTSRPLLETPRLVPRETCRRSGRGVPPSLLLPLARWAAAHLRRCGCRPLTGAAGGATAVIAAWQVHTLLEERVLRVLPHSGGCCGHMGRPHKRRHIVLAIDLVSGECVQQCLDAACRVPRGRGYVAAGRTLGWCPAACLPCVTALDTWAHISP